MTVLLPSLGPLPPGLASWWRKRIPWCGMKALVLMSTTWWWLGSGVPRHSPLIWSISRHHRYPSGATFGWYFKGLHLKVPGWPRSRCVGVHIWCQCPKLEGIQGSTTCLRLFFSEKKKNLTVPHACPRLKPQAPGSVFVSNLQGPLPGGRKFLHWGVSVLCIVAKISLNGFFFRNMLLELHTDRVTKFVSFVTSLVSIS